MPGYYDWKVRNCGKGAITAAKSLLETMEMVDTHLHEIWEANNGKFPVEVDDRLADVVGLIDDAEESLLAAKLKLAELFPGHPKLTT